MEKTELAIANGYNSDEKPEAIGLCGRVLLFALLAFITTTLSSTAAFSQSGSLLVSRPLPITNYNLGQPGENPSRSNLRWFNARPTNSGDTVAIGDDFTVGTAGEKYIINTVQVWIVTLATQDSDPANPDLRNSHPNLSLLGGKVSDGPAGVAQLLTGTTGSGDISFSRVRYSDNEDYWTLPSAREEPIWKVTFSNLNWSVDGGTSYQFFVSGTPVLVDSGTTQLSVELHASNAALGGNTQDDADGLYRIARLVSGITQSVDTKNSDPTGTPTGTLPNGGWNKNSDINVAVYGDRLVTVSGTVLSRSGQAVPNATVMVGLHGAVSDSSGRFTVSEVPPGSYSVFARLDDRLFVPSNFANPLTIQSVDKVGINLVENNFQVSGLFSCDPIGNITVTAGDTSIKSVFGRGFTIPNLRAGTYTLSASHPGFTFSTQSIVVSNSDRSGIKIVAKPANMAAPTVVVAKNKATFTFATFPGFETTYLIKVLLPNQKTELGYLTQKSSYALKNLPKGKYKVKVQAGIGPYGQRVATKDSAWKNFTIGAPIAATVVKKKATPGVRTTKLRSLEATLAAERKQKITVKK